MELPQMANTRRNGSIYQRKDGRWVAQLRIDGRQVTRYGRTKTEAQANLRELRSNPPLLPEADKPSPLLTVADFVDQWIASAGLKPATEESYRHNLKAHVLPVIGHMSVADVTAADVARVVAECRAKGRSPRTAQYAYTLTRRLLQVAFDWEIIPTNPALKVKRPTTHPKERDMWTIEETTVFITYCRQIDGMWADLFLFAVLSGLRLSEILGLEWGDVDWKKNSIKVNRSLVELKGSVFIEQSPKSRSSVRTVALPPEAMDTLKSRYRGTQHSGPVFRRDTGKPPRRHSLAEQLRRFCTKAGVPYISLHGLRHQHVSLLAHAGVPVKVAQQRVGHSNPMLTLGIYTHVLGDADVEAAAALSALVSSKEAKDDGGS
jgi:integrase